MKIFHLRLLDGLDEGMDGWVDEWMPRTSVRIALVLGLGSRCRFSPSRHMPTKRHERPKSADTGCTHFQISHVHMPSVVHPPCMGREFGARPGVGDKEDSQVVGGPIKRGADLIQL